MIGQMELFNFGHKPFHGQSTSFLQENTAQEQAVSMLREGINYKIIAFSLDIRASEISKIAKKTGLQSKHSKIQCEKIKKINKTLKVEQEVVALKRPPVPARPDFIIYVKGDDGRAVLAHPDQCKRIFGGIKTDPRMDYWCGKPRDKGFKQGLYCKSCYHDLHGKKHDDSF